MLIIIVNAAAILAVEITVYRTKRTVSGSETRHQQGWRRKLGIETSQDLLIFSIIVGAAVVVLVTLAFASLGYIVPLPY